MYKHNHTCPNGNILVLLLERLETVRHLACEVEAVRGRHCCCCSCTHCTQTHNTDKQRMETYSFFFSLGAYGPLGISRARSRRCAAARHCCSCARSTRDWKRAAIRSLNEDTRAVSVCGRQKQMLSYYLHIYAHTLARAYMLLLGFEAAPVPFGFKHTHNTENTQRKQNRACAPCI